MTGSGSFWPCCVNTVALSLTPSRAGTFTPHCMSMPGSPAPVFIFAGNVTQQARQCGHGFVRLIAKLHAKQFLNVADGHAAAHDRATIRFANDVRRRWLSIVSSFADNLFHQVFDGCDARYRPVLVDNHG